MRKFLLVSLVCLLHVSITWAQERTITGKVTASEDGSPLPGVNVVVKGTTTGTVTDAEGSYRLSVPESGSILIFSFIGLVTQEVEIAGRSVVDLPMQQDIQQLGEVVVTAVGIEREKKALGYSVESVGGDRVSQVAEPDPLRALTAKVPGVNIISSSGAPGSSTRITIRGNTSLLNNNQPLFVVDGIPYNNDYVTTEGTNTNTGGLTAGGAFSSRISDLDPNDIKSMTILKGANAAALYGSRAANGVIVITTKSGSASASKKGLEITYSGTFGIEKIANLPNFQNTYGTGTNFAYAQANGSWGAPFIGTRPYATLDSIPHWYAGRDGMGEFDGVKVPYKAYPNNVKNFFETGQIFENSISIAGGNEKSAISVTLSQTKQKGFVPETEFTRHNISIGGKTVLTNGFIIGGNLAYTRSVQNGVLSGAPSATSGDPSAFARTLYFGRNWDVQGQPYQNPVDMGSEFMVGRDQVNNPYWAVENSGIRSKVDRYVASFNASYDIKDWLNLTYRVGINGYAQDTYEFQRPNGAGAPLGSITTVDVFSDEINSDLIATVTKDINENFTVRALAGWNVNQRTNRTRSVNGVGYVVFDIDDIPNVNAVTPNPNSGYSRRRLQGVYADVNFGYKDWAFLTLTGRNDWSSTLPVQNRSFFYPAVNASVMLNEALGLSSSMINSIKLRAGWASVGNDTNPYLLSTVYIVNDFDNVTNNAAGRPFTPDGGAATIPTAGQSFLLTDPNLKPEITTEIEAGFDARLWNDRVGVNFTYYSKESRDQIAQISLPEESGYQAQLTNFGTVTNKGVEIGVDITPVRLENGFTWTIGGSFTKNVNEIKELREGVNEIQFGSGFGGSVISVHRPGEQYGMLLGTVDARDDEGNLLIDPATGQFIRALDTELIGNPNPDFILGITNTISFKGITISALWDLRQGGDLYSTTVNAMLGRGVLAYQADREGNSIIKGVYGDPNTFEPYLDDDGNTIPNQTMIETNSLYFGESFAVNAADEWSVFDATTYRLREASITYSIPRSILSKTPFGAISVGFIGRNLWNYSPNFPKDLNYDPETNQFGARNVQGLEYSTTPSAKRFSFTVRATF
ncbi:MAG TPA: SusC/RagA family TonB-linked outer membrane protein [Ohtaekwangia sp.]